MLTILASAFSAACPPASAVEALLDRGDIYLGELHGTQETPRLVECLVEAAVAEGDDRIVVSLELPESAREITSPVWSGTDGRTSKAMQRLVRTLIAHEASGRLRIHWQRTGPFENAEHFDVTTGETLRRLAGDGRLIALSGNFHTLRKPQEWAPNAKTAGMYTGQNVTSVIVESLRGGQAWFCSAPDNCGPEDLPASSDATATAYLMKDGSRYGHDLVFYLDRFTYSPPALGPIPKAP